MVTLETMSLEEYTSWKRNVIRDYAEAKIRVGNIPSEDALDASEVEFMELFPNELNTLDAEFYTVVDKNRDKKVGLLCTKIRNQGREVLICDIQINETFRGQGYGKQTLEALELQVRQLGIPKISLHVFGDNEIALKLYRSFGFVATNLLMSKVLTN